MSLDKVIQKSMKNLEYLAKHFFGGYFRGSFSQQKQDRWISDIVFPEESNRFFVEVGGHDGISISNTYYLEKFKDWKGVIIEPNPKLFESVKKTRDIDCLNCAISERNGKIEFAPDGETGRVLCEEEGEDLRTIEVDACTLKRALDDVDAPRVIDYLSVDVEGHESKVFSGFPLREYEILAITVESPQNDLRKKLRKNGYIKIIEVPQVDCLYVNKKISKNIMRGFTDISWSHLEFKINGMIEKI